MPQPVPGDHLLALLRLADANQLDDTPHWLTYALRPTIDDGLIDGDTRTLTPAGQDRLAGLHEAYTGPPRTCGCEENNIAPDRHHEHWFFLRRDLSTGLPLEAVVWAVWRGGFKEIRTWPWDSSGEGLAEAQAWCDEHGALWKHNNLPVQSNSLAVHASST